MKMRNYLSRLREKPLVLVILVFILALSTWTYSWAQTPKHWGGATQADAEASSAAVALSGVPCIAGFAGPYPCKNVDLLAYLPMNGVAASTSADIWGWTDPQTGKEYAIIGHGNATTFIDVTDPTLPVVVGDLPAPAVNVLWRDVKTYENYAYIVGDGNPVGVHGLQIFDLTQLRDAGPVPTVFTQTSIYTGFDNAHNIAINEETGFAYAVGSNTCSAGLHMLDLSDPANPAFAGCFSEDGYTHDTECVVYYGPDAEYQGREVCFAANEDTLTLVDVTDKSAPVMLARAPYEGFGYTHQGWLTEDQAYFLLGDELDEMNNGHNTHTYLWNVSDLDAPVHFATYVGPTPSIDHNLFIRENFVYESNYTSGLRILDVSDVANGNLVEVAYFDTHPSNDAPVFAGTWSNYPFFKSGIVILSNIEDGLFVLKPNLPAGPLEAQAEGGGWLAGDGGGKINFGFDVEQSSAGARSGELRLNDKEAGVKIELTEVTSVQDGAGCAAQVSVENALEIFGQGTFNGQAASFRACVADNGEPGKGQDQFYLECADGSCTYSTASATGDNTIGGGNIQVRSGSGGGEGSEPAATTLILDPLLLTDGLTGQLQTFTVSVFDQNGEPMTGVSVELVRTAADGTTETTTALTDLTGLALFTVTNLNQAAEYIANVGGIESNAIALDPVLK